MVLGDDVLLRGSGVRFRVLKVRVLESLVENVRVWLVHDLAAEREVLVPAVIAASLYPLGLLHKLVTLLARRLSGSRILDFLELTRVLVLKIWTLRKFLVDVVGIEVVSGIHL